MRSLLACSLFALMVPSSALPLTIRAIIGDRERNDMSASVIEGIVVGILALIIIPLLWYAYKMCTRTRPAPTPLFAPSPLLFTSPGPNNSNIPSSARHITRPRPAHTKVNAPTYGA